MELTSCLYETQIMHHRLSPKEHRFSYKFFSFYLDLDRIDAVTQKLRLVSRNRFNVHGFYDRDHIEKGGASVKANILMYLQEQGIDLADGRIMLLTYLRMFGYVFNPVSLYYCFDKADNPVCVVLEIGNTFGELKPFLIRAEQLKGHKFTERQDKFYYISPFTQLDDQLDFKLAIPDEHLNICIDTSKQNQKVILTSMLGKRKELTDLNLLKLTLAIPFMTLKVSTLIHWHAFRLWLKKVPYEEKTKNTHLQKGVYRVWNKNSKDRRGRRAAKKIKYISEHR